MKGRKKNVLPRKASAALKQALASLPAREQKVAKRFLSCIKQTKTCTAVNTYISLVSVMRHITDTRYFDLSSKEMNEREAGQWNLVKRAKPGDALWIHSHVLESRFQSGMRLEVVRIRRRLRGVLCRCPDGQKGDLVTFSVQNLVMLDIRQQLDPALFVKSSALLLSGAGGK